MGTEPFTKHLCVKARKRILRLLAVTGLLTLAVSACSEMEQKQAAPIDPAQAPITSRIEKKIENNPTKNAYFGDLHVHTGNSFDSYIFYNRTTPDDAYHFAKGGTIRHPLQYKLNLTTPPLDFLAVTDHAEYLGILRAMNETDHRVSRAPGAQDMFSTDQDKITAAFSKVGESVRSGIRYEDFYDEEITKTTWARSQEMADRHYEPGKFTTFKAYEYTAMITTERISGENSVSVDGLTIAGGNLHRNVIFKDDAPEDVFGSLHSINPEDLWDWMDAKREAGFDVMSIPHNSNVSDGAMFDLTQYDGSPIDRAYTEQRRRNEPVVEITQVKGTSETHPSISPNDEWADFELYEYLLASNIKSKISGGFVREALGNGLGLADEGKGNPYKFGLIGSSDSHVAAGSYDEETYWSKIGILDGTSARRASVPGYFKKTWEGIEVDPNVEATFMVWGASGLAGIWAPENTREALFEGMRNRETFATSGTRIRVRLFAGYDFEDTILSDPKLLEKAYANGVPMGGELAHREGQQPTLLAWAMRDPYATPLQRLQIVKVWHEAGKPQEKIYDAACADGLSPDPATHRCPDNGARVDTKTCAITPEKGDPELSVVWRDPDFKAGQNVSYYVRVLENPTCRWSTWDAVHSHAQPNPDMKKIIQERAWSSPVWIGETE
ncbi:MAG: DUF3604 domain-containing protein [Parvibaculales bacterium]